MLSEYKDIFGKPGEGAHSYRFLGIAIVDLLLTVLLAFGISKYAETSFVDTLIVLLLLGVILHRLFGVNTAANKKIFGEV